MSQYVIHCILPYARKCKIVNGSVVIADKSDTLQGTVTDRTTKVKVILEDKSVQLLDFESLGEKFGFEYSTYLQCLHESVFRNILYWGLDSSACVPSAEDAGYSSNIQRGYVSENVSVRYVGLVGDVDVGYGLFADSALSAGYMVGEYVGVLMENSSAISSAYCLNYPSANNGYIINANEIGNLIRFVNHSDSPNAQFQPYVYDDMVHVVCVCVRKVEPDEQITVSYGKAYWAAQNYNPVAIS